MCQFIKDAPHLASPQKEGEFTLHGRAILEMEQYIRETYPDAVKVCNICRGLLIQVPGAGRGALSRTHSGPRPLTGLEPPRREQTMGVSSEASDDKCMGGLPLPPGSSVLSQALFFFFSPERLSEAFCGAHIILAAVRHTSFCPSYIFLLAVCLCVRCMASEQGSWTSAG